MTNMSQTQQTTSQAPSAGGRPRKKGSRARWIVAVLLLAGLGTWYLVQRNSEPEVQNQPLLATVERGNIENTISAAGSLQPSRYIDVGAQVSGQLQKLHVEVGDKVEENQLLAEIDARTQQSRVDSARSALEALESQIDSRRASLDLARANARRQERLKEASATSDQDYDSAMANLASAEANFAQLQKQIDQARSTLVYEETQLEYTRIYAPMTGTVVSIEMNEGRTLNANQQAPTILRIADLSTMRVETEISEADIGNVKPGMDVYFTTLAGGNRRWTSKLRQILPTPVIENNVVLYTGLFEVDNSDDSLLPEMTAQVFFITASARDVLTVPVGALTFARPAAPTGGARPSMPPEGAGQAAGGPRPGAAASGPRSATVDVIAADGTRQTREVMIGVTSRVSAEVLSGLQAGEQVVAGIIQNGAAGSAPQGFGPPPGGFGGFR